MGGGGGARLCPGPSARSRSLGPPVPRRVRRSHHELHAVQQGPVLRALGRGQEPGEWTRAHRRGAQPGAHRRERGGFAPTPEGWGRSGKRGAARSGRGTPLLCTRGAPAAPPPDIPRPTPGVFRVPSSWKDVSKTPERAGGWESGRSDPRDPLSTCQHFPFSPPRAVKLGTGRGRDRGLLNRVWLPSPLLGLPTHTWERAHGVGGGLRHNGTSKSPVSEGPTHSKES